MIQDTEYRRVGSSRINKVGVVALVGVIAAVGMFAYSSQPQIQALTSKPDQVQVVNLFKILQDTTSADPTSSDATDVSASDDSSSDANTASSDDSTAPVTDWAALRNSTDACNQLADTYWAQVQGLNA